MTTLYLVRHVKAGDRAKWDGRDEDRPISKAGARQAEAIAHRLARHLPTQLLSSPFLRCRQSLEPLARATDLDIVSDQRLAEGEPFEPALELLATLPDGAVLCSHGDLIPAVMQALDRRGCRFKGEPDWRKGTVWTLAREGDVITTASVWHASD